jgi:hypothetical protein
LTPLLPWALQEEVVRNPSMPGDERLMKALLSFKSLLQYFDLSGMPRDPGVSKRFDGQMTKALTFAPDAS